MVHLCEWLTLSQISSGEIKQEKRKKIKKEIKKSKKGERAIFWHKNNSEESEREEKREREKGEKKRVKILSKIQGNRTIGFRRKKRQSWSTHRELRVSTKILEFR